jgi:hypothetical protein
MKLECRRGISPTPLNMRGTFSSFPPFFKGSGAGVTDSLRFYNFGHIYTLTNSNTSTTSTGGNSQLEVMGNDKFV